MDKRYFYHRISYESNVSYALLERGYLTLGWSKFADTTILDVAREQQKTEFNRIAADYDEYHNKARWSVWHFAQMKAGDVILVPLYGGMFSIYRVCEEAQPISVLENEIAYVVGKWDEKCITWKNHHLYDEEAEHTIDIGFFLKVEPIVSNIPRSFVSGKLASCMKRPPTNGDITYLGEFVDDAIKAGQANKPITLYDNVIEQLVEMLRTSITTSLNPDKFEKLIKWYLERCGASKAWIPAKNERGKVDGADADVIAEFDNLKYIVYVQAKWHVGTTSEWSVYQIDGYKNQMSECDSAYTYATWVISSADGFSPLAVAEAEKRGVRLIDGKEFAQMLLNIGLLDLNDAFN